jgi:ABC-type antimicrobial peptide transport system permease subunit
LGGLAKTNPQAIGALGWVFFVLQVVSLLLSWIYFLPPPVVLSAIVAICTGWAAWLIPASNAAR